MRVLVVRVTSMGDVVLTLPAISDMADQVPGIEIDWLVEKPFASIASMHPAVKTVYPVTWRKWRKTLWKSETRQAFSAFRQNLRAAPYDLILDFQGQIAKSVILGMQAKGPLGGFAWQGLREPLSSLFYRRKAQVSKTLHLVPRSRAMAAALMGYALPSTEVDYRMRVEVPFWRPVVTTGLDSFALLIPHASRPEKHWPEERWVAIGRRLRALGHQVVVFWGSPAEEVMAKHLAAQFNGQVPPFLTVAQAASVLAQAHVVVGLDTGFTHMAAGLERPTVGIYCDFDPKLAGVMSRGFTESLGGIGQYPPLEEVNQALSRALEWRKS
jgi:heptosyltransferase I